MFNLENAIKSWKRKLRSNPAFEDGDVAELESHLRDEVERLKSEGMSEGEAFNHASEELGEPEPIGDEFYKSRATQKAGSVPSWKQKSWVPSLLPNYLKVAMRYLKKDLPYTVINITGFSAGLTICLLIFLYIWHEYSFDTFHENADRIYRITSLLDMEGEKQLIASAGGPVGPTLQSELPELEHMTRLFSTGFLFQKDDVRFQEDDIFYADSTLFDIFDFSLIRGNPGMALAAPYSIVLTRETAEKYFGDEDPVGQTIIADKNHALTVTGLIEDVPDNSHLQFDALISMTTMEKLQPDRDDNWTMIGYYTYILLPTQHNFPLITRKINEIAHENTHESLSRLDAELTLQLEHLPEIYLHSKKLSQAGPTGSAENLYIFTVVALFILVIASVNFINLSASRSVDRAKEVGIRKVLGAGRSVLVKQYLAESMLLITITVAFSIYLAWLGVPFFEQFTGRPLNRSILFRSEFLIIVLGLIPILSVLAGGYPAFILANFEPADALSGNTHLSLPQGLFRKGLVVFQFGISIILIVGTLVIYRQLNFIQNRDLGISRDQIVTIDFNFDPEVQRRREVIKQSFRELSGVKVASMSSTVPGKRFALAGLRLESEDGNMHTVNLNMYAVDYDFASQYGLKIVAGRSFSESFSTDSSRAMIINEAAARMMGYPSPEEALGKEFEWVNKSGEIIGVISDFHYSSLHQPVEPMGLWINSGALGYLSLTLESGAVSSTLNKLKQCWEALVPGRPFSYSFLDDTIQQQYKSDQQFGHLIFFFSIFAVTIACLGLFGLTSYTIHKRRKEIGIRKVLGATVSIIIGLLTKDFLKLVLAGAVMGIPLAWYMAHRWLANFAYRIEPGMGIFVLAVILMLIIAGLAIVFQSINAARINPVESLRSE